MPRSRKGVMSAIGAQLVKLEMMAFIAGVIVGVIGFIVAFRFGFLPEEMARNVLGIAAESAQNTP